MLKPTDTTTNRKIVLNSRPVGEPTDANFRLEVEELGAPKAGEMLVKNHYLSLDPYMRGMMSDLDSYAEPVAIGGTMIGFTVSEVLASRRDGVKAGDWLLTYGGWQEHAIS
ncbi:MAG: NADP-dependent oxidoreductase, partial [Albidovulum sp.]